MSTSSNSSSLQPWLFAALLFAAALFLFTRENRFPFYYHPDEPGKVEQIRTHQWNFNHPMLMLSTARLAVKVHGGGDDPQRVVEAGRFVSAAFAAGAVALLSGVVWMLAGRFAAAAAGLLLVSNHQLFELAHYFKEDTSLLFGLSAWLLAMAVFWRRPGVGTALLAGAGAALAASGKYIGVAAVVLSPVLIVPRLPKGRRVAALCGFLAVLAAVFSAINLPLLLTLDTFRASLHREVDFVVAGQRGMTRSVPHSAYLTAFRENIFFLLWPLVAWFYYRCWQRRRELSGFEWLVALFPVCYLVFLSFSPKENDRYFLPATALFLCVVGMGAALLRDRWNFRRATWAILLFLVAAQIPATWAYYSAFRRDDLAELTEWLNRELPAAVLAQDRKVMLPAEKRPKFLQYQPPLKARVVGKNVESFKTIENLRAAGVTHVVLSQSSYGRYFRKSLRPQAGGEEEYRKSGQLYLLLMEGNPPLWKRERGTVLYLHPGLEVYRLP